MKRMLRTGLVVLGIGIVSLALLNCDPDLFAGSLLDGTWVKADDEYRWTFNSTNSSFVEENWVGSAWQTVSDGDYSYNASQHDLELDDQMNGNEVVYDIIMNSEADRMALGEDALTGGNTSTLLGTWVGGFTVDGVTMEHEWVLTSTTISHTNFTGNTATGDVSIDTAAKQFTVSSSSDAGVLATGIYNYIMIGDGITISEAGTAVDAYYDKQ